MAVQQPSLPHSLTLSHSLSGFLLFPWIWKKKDKGSAHARGFYCARKCNRPFSNTATAAQGFKEAVSPTCFIILIAAVPKKGNIRPVQIWSTLMMIVLATLSAPDCSSRVIQVLQRQTNLIRSFNSGSLLRIAHSGTSEIVWANVTLRKFRINPVLSVFIWK